MNDVVSLIGGVFGMLNFSIFGVPLIAWILIPAFFGLIGLFVRGKKE